MGALAAYSYHYLTSSIGFAWDTRAGKAISEFVSGTWLENQEMITPTIGALVTLGALTYSFPLFMAPVLLASYFIGGYIRDHAVIRVVPLFHKGIPYVTGLEGFRAPESGDAILEGYRLLRRSVSEGVDSVAQLWADVNDSNRNSALLRTLMEW
jgi:hypothetical protein